MWRKKKNFQTESLHLKEHEQLSGEEITPLPGEKMSDQCAPVRAPICASKFQVVFTILLRNIIELSHICVLMETFFSKLDEQKNGSRGRIYLRSQSPVAAGGR